MPKIPPHLLCAAGDMLFSMLEDRPHVDFNVDIFDGSMAKQMQMHHAIGMRFADPNIDTNAEGIILRAAQSLVRKGLLAVEAIDNKNPADDFDDLRYTLTGAGRQHIASGRNCDFLRETESPPRPSFGAMLRAALQPAKWPMMIAAAGRQEIDKQMTQLRSRLYDDSGATISIPMHEA